MNTGRTLRDPWESARIALPWIFVLVCLGLQFGLSFQQYHNDFWDVHFVASRMTASDRASWFNPQYPIGYTVLLRGLGAWGSPVVPSILMNLFFAFCTLSIASRVFARFLSAPAAFGATLALCVFPEFYRYANVGGGDPGAALFFTAGSALLAFALYGTGSGEESGAGMFFGAGVLLGVAALFRYHALVGSALLGIALLAVYPRYWKQGLFTVAGILLAYSPQWAVNVLSGHRLMETQFGPMNVYDLMHGINWYRVTGLRLPESVTAIVAEDPALFLRKYAGALWSFKLAYLPLISAAVLERDPRKRRFFLALSLWVILYFVLFSATTSGRQGVLVAPWACLGLAATFQRLWGLRGAGFRGSFSAGARPVAVSALGLLLLAHCLYRDVLWTSKRAELRDDRVALEDILRRSGAARANKIFTSDFDLYFTTLPGPIPYFNGGAPRLGTYGYNAAFPEFPVDSPAAFVETCRRLGVRFVVLHDASADLSQPLGALYAGQGGIDGLEPVSGGTPRHKIFRVL
jgi:hypothetical protein